MKLCIDAGHGGSDSGAVGINGRMEKSDNLRYAKAIQAEMTKRGHTVLMTRAGDTYPSLNARADAANNWGADGFISCHRNSFDSSANGGEVLYGPNASKTSIKLAEAINSKMNAAVGFKNRGAKRQAATVLQRTKMPAVTIEAGFVSNAEDNSKFDSKFTAMVAGICDAIESVFGKGTQPVPPVVPDSDPYAYVVNKDAESYKYSGTIAQGQKVHLLSHYEGCNVANVRFEDGTSGFVLWTDLQKG